MLGFGIPRPAELKESHAGLLKQSPRLPMMSTERIVIPREIGMLGRLLIAVSAVLVTLPLPL